MKTVMLRNVEVGCGKPKVIVPIVAATAQGILEKAREFRAHALDVVEWRVDFYEDVFQLPKVLSTLKGLRESRKSKKRIRCCGRSWGRPPSCSPSAPGRRGARRRSTWKPIRR